MDREEVLPLVPARVIPARVVSWALSGRSRNGRSGLLRLDVVWACVRVPGAREGCSHLRTITAATAPPLSLYATSALH